MSAWWRDVGVEEQGVGRRQAERGCHDVQLEPQLQLEEPEQPQSPAIVNGGLVCLKRVCGWSLLKFL